MAATRLLVAVGERHVELFLDAALEICTFNVGLMILKVIGRCQSEENA